MTSIKVYLQLLVSRDQHVFLACNIQVAVTQPKVSQHFDSIYFYIYIAYYLFDFVFSCTIFKLKVYIKYHIKYIDNALL